MSPLNATAVQSLLLPCIVYHIRLISFDFSNHLVSGICSILTKITKIFFGSQMNSYKIYILIDEVIYINRWRGERNIQSLKDFNCLIEIWPIHGPYLSLSLSSASTSKFSKSKKISLTVFTGIWTSSKCWTYSRYHITVNRINELY